MFYQVCRGRFQTVGSCHPNNEVRVAARKSATAICSGILLYLKTKLSQVLIKMLACFLENHCFPRGLQKKWDERSFFSQRIHWGQIRSHMCINQNTAAVPSCAIYFWDDVYAYGLKTDPTKQHFSKYPN